MPCILKQRTKDSPGIVSFTHNETLRGLPARSKRVRDFLIESTKSGDWIWGTQIQGFVGGYVREWPQQPWESFLLWTDKESFLEKVPAEKILDLNCVNFMPEIAAAPEGGERPYDICFIGHATGIKRIYEVLQVVRRLMDQKPDLTVVFIVPDQRNLERGLDTYNREEIDRRYFELPLKLFSSSELKQLSFISSSTHAFGKFPLAAGLVWDIIRKSKFLFSFSLYEGTPRVFAEALLCGTPCAINRETKFGMRRAHSQENTLWLTNDVETAANELFQGLSHYQEYRVNRDAVLDAFAESRNVPKLKHFLKGVLESKGKSVGGDWYLEDLNVRLPCHGKKVGHQFMYNEALFFDWIERVQRFHPYDEDSILGIHPVDDRKPLSARLEELNRQFRAKVSPFLPDSLKHALRRL